MAGGGVPGKAHEVREIKFISEHKSVPKINIRGKEMKRKKKFANIMYGSPLIRKLEDDGHRIAAKGDHFSRLKRRALLFRLARDFQ